VGHALIRPPFYPAVLVPKSNPWLGWTLNLGHPFAPTALLLSVVAPALAVAALGRRK